MEAQVNHLPKSRRRVIKNLTALDDSYMGDFTLCSVALAKQGGGILSPSALCVLAFILGRTLVFRKKAEVITSYQFENGVTGKDGVAVSSGCGVSASTTRRSLKELSEKGFIKIHTFSDGKKEQHARAYEVKIESIKAIADLESARNWLKREGFYGQNYANRGVKFTPYPGKSGENVPFLGCQIYHTITDNDKSLSNKILSNDNISQPEAATKENEKMIPTPRKGRRAVNAIDCKIPAKDIPTAIKSKHSTTLDSRVAASRKVSTRKWSTTELQALLDKARGLASESGAQANRIVVVSKNIGVFHKRVLAADIPDVLEFLEWVYRNWSKVANSNKRAKARQVKVNQRTESTMALTPNFNDLAFRLPYFIAIYNDSKALEKAEQDEQQTALQEVDRKLRTREEVIAERKRKAEEIDLAEEQLRKRREAQAVTAKGTATRVKRRVTKTVTREDHSDSYGEELPEWRER